MAAYSADTQWHSSSKWLHWILFLVVVATFVAVSMAQSYERGTDERTWWMVLHRSFGVSAALLMIAWLFVRRRVGRPAPYGAPWQIRLSRFTHWGMVGLVIGLPLAGLLMSQFAGRDVLLFFVLPIPAFLPESEALAQQIYSLHTNVAAPLFFMLILLHIVGALWHHFKEKDATLKRMLPGGDA